MKIRGKFIIPLIALLIAVLTLGTVPGMASDTSASSEISQESTVDDYTYVAPTFPTEPPMDEMITDMVSSVLSDDLQNAEGPLRGFSETMSRVLTAIRDAINDLIKAIQNILGSSGNLGDSLGGILG